MLKNIQVFIVLIFFSLITYAQNQSKEKISGIVNTSDGKAAEYIMVSLKGTKYGSLTNDKGRFEFEAPTGNYNLLLKSIGIETQEYPIKIQSGVNNYFPNLIVEDDKHQLDEIVVTGQFSPQSLRNSLYKVKVINNQMIMQKAATDIQSLLNTQIGIRASNDLMLGESNFELMGMGGNNVKILLDGVPLIDRGSIKQSLSQIDVNNIKQIEIVEGPMSVVYGTDALAGVVNIITKTNASHTDRNNYSISARIQEESVGDEYKLLKGKGIHNENIAGSWSSTFGLYANSSFSRNTLGGWKGDKTGREKLWPPKDQYFYEGLVGFKKQNFNLWYRLNYLNEKISIPQNGSDVAPYIIADKSYKTNRYTHILQGDWTINNKLGINVTSSLQDYNRKTKTIITDLETSKKWLSTDESSQAKSEYKSAFVRATAAWKTNDYISFQPGVEYSIDKDLGERIEGNHSISSLALFMSAEWKPFTKVSLRPGLRAIIKSDFDAPLAIPSLNTKFVLNSNLDLRFSYAYGFRAPTLQELYFSFHDASHNIDGNPNLKAEYSNNFSGSLSWRFVNTNDLKITTILSLFYNDFRDKITLTQAIDNSMLTTYYNVSRFKTLGGTLENTLVWKDLQADINFSLIGRYNEYVDEEAYVDQNLPTFKYSPELSANVSYFLRRSKTQLNLFYKYTGARHQYSYNSVTKDLYLGKLGSYNTADFTLSQHLGKDVTLNAGIKNIFNIKTINNTIREDVHDLGTSSSSLLGYGRSYFIGMRFSFNN